MSLCEINTDDILSYMESEILLWETLSSLGFMSDGLIRSFYITFTEMEVENVAKPLNKMQALLKSFDAPIVCGRRIEIALE